MKMSKKTPHGVAAVLLVLYLGMISNNYNLAICSSNHTAGFSLKMIPIHSQESPLYPGHLNDSQRIQTFISISKSRVQYWSSIPQNTSLQSKNLVLPLTFRRPFLIVGLKIGSYQVYLLMDTGSELTWTQCKPCIRCYHQEYPIYDSTHSRTFRHLHCNHAFCRTDPRVFRCSDGTCYYHIRYGNGEEGAKGFLAKETFRFSSGHNPNNVVFGCSNDNHFVGLTQTGVISGIMGLDRQPISIVNQLHEITHRRFSYCLAPFTSPIVASGLLRFGNAIPHPTGNIQRTPFVQEGGTILSVGYHLHLIDISVGAHRLEFPPHTFESNGNRGGCLIDSGSVMTYINQNANGENAYSKVINSFKDYFSQFSLRRLSGQNGLEVCYGIDHNFDEYASMTFHFLRADYVVSPQHVYVVNHEQRYFCVALMPYRGKTIIGAYQQQNMRITYDANVGELQFAPEHCAQDS